MFKESYLHIKVSYEGKVIIYPPVLYADESLGEWPNIAFFVVEAEKNATDMVVVSSQTGEVMGVTSVQGIELKSRNESCDIESIDDEITNICVNMIRNNNTIKDAYTQYLKHTFPDPNEMYLVAALCPNAISHEILKHLGSTPKLAKNTLAELGRRIVFMEKSVPEVLKNIPAWIDNIPVAKAYKNAVIAGNGDRLFRIIKMTGNPEAYKKCVEDFADFLFRMKLVNDKNISNTTAGAIHSNVEQVIDRPGTYWFFDDDHNPTPGTKMVVFNITDVKIENKKIKRLIEKLGLATDYATFSLLLEDYPGWENIDEDVFVNNTILTHYSNHQDDNLKATDLEWINDILIGNDANSIIVTSNKQLQANTISQEEIFEPVKHQASESIPAEPISVKTSNSFDLNSSPSDNSTEMEVDKFNEEKEMINKNQQNNNASAEMDNKNTPSPEESEEDIEETVESALEKIEFNKKLSDQMYEIYEQTIARLKAERDSRWKDFIDEYKKAIEEENYTVRTCPRYLTITSRDIKAPIYKVLYEADKATNRYEKELKRIKKKTLCFACHNTFIADLTFAKHKEHVEKCPHCGNLVRMTIEWLDK